MAKKWFPPFKRNPPQKTEFVLLDQFTSKDIDVPSSPQIFGQLVWEAGIEGILYNSKFSEKECLVIFPQNFDETCGSFVELDDPAPQEAKILKWDVDTWRQYGKGQ